MIDVCPGVSFRFCAGGQWGEDEDENSRAN